MAISRAAKKTQRGKTQTEHKAGLQALIGKIEQLTLPSQETESSPSDTPRPSAPSPAKGK